jgi:hypothetical protein
LTVAAILATVACQLWEPWDNVFKRLTVGWSSADGGSTVTLPGNRLLWVFGDTYLNPHTPGPDPAAPVPQYAFGNTLGVHPIGIPQYAAPAPSGASFFARDLNGVAANITSSVPSGGATQYFRRSSCNRTDEGLAWPGDGIVVGTTNLFYMTWAIESPPPDTPPPALPYFKQNIIQKFTGVTSGSTPIAWGCTTATPLPAQYSPLPPSDATLASDPPLMWGVAIIEDPSTHDIYIFGTRRDPDSLDTQNLPDAVLARAWIALGSLGSCSLDVRGVADGEV